MARLSFIHGAITGKLGEFVGSKWKGINYLRTYAKPSNPRTEGQISIRKVFKALSDFATALYAEGFFEIIPTARRMTERNSVFKANKAMLTNKVYDKGNLQIAPPNMNSFVTDPSCGQDTPNNRISIHPHFTLDKRFVGKSKIDLHYVFYDTVNHRVIHKNKMNNIEGETFGTGLYFTYFTGWNTPTGFNPANCRWLFFITTEYEGKKYIGKTVSCTHTGIVGS